MANSTLRFSYRHLASCCFSAFGRLLLLVGLLLAARQSHAQGFSTAATPWALPAGGYATTSHDYSYPTLAHTSTSASTLDHTWATLDMNGDAKPDLVVLTEGNGTYNEPFGTGSPGRYWKVYLNTGSGYASTAIAWSLPAGGRIVTGSGHLASFDALAYAGSAYTGNQGWTVLDMNGDARPDLVV
ncbi:MAG: VCBS repeat-containing protein, partial [Hymenobacter sp.]